MRLTTRASFAVICAVSLAVVCSPSSSADETPTTHGFSSDGTAGDAEVWATTGRGKGSSTGDAGGSERKVSAISAAERQRALDKQAKAHLDYLGRKRKFDACRATSAAVQCADPGPEVQAPPLDGYTVLDLPTISPEQAAYTAIARLHLDPPAPGIGPSPDINQWHIAAVGYPYWLWADGNLNPAPVSTTVGPLTVRLQAHLARTTFDLGDGTRLTCTDLTQHWTPAVEPGAPSPVCGHTWTTPSLPKGNYTITAYSTWAVDWTVNGVGGTIPLYQQATTTLPVGELQVLTH